MGTLVNLRGELKALGSWTHGRAFRYFGVSRFPCVGELQSAPRDKRTGWSCSASHFSLCCDSRAFSVSRFLVRSLMEDYRRCHIPAFGNWDYSDNLPITQYFESARQAGLIRYNDYGVEDQDLYGESLKSSVPTTVSRPKQVKGSSKRYQYVKEAKKVGKVCDVTEPPRIPRAPKAVDEDLYKIPPELLRGRPRKSKFMGFLSRCLVPDCTA
ncbi:hypothetical protein H6P81_014072 [Aristolochia fimbriata]|uniref:Uncharacterized protein n=1 Tax=Aristolochia fimbriata TaxID=158543 RepID=A0AAV7EGX0_ARIFI|nr:hypothetical protein H6P81_014072 [Aristolochia fimbriata]